MKVLEYVFAVVVDAIICLVPRRFFYHFYLCYNLLLFCLFFFLALILYRYFSRVQLPMPCIMDVDLVHYIEIKMTPNERKNEYRKKNQPSLYIFGDLFIYQFFFGSSIQYTQTHYTSPRATIFAFVQFSFCGKNVSFFPLYFFVKK